MSFLLLFDSDLESQTSPEELPCGSSSWTRLSRGINGLELALEIELVFAFAFEFAFALAVEVELFAFTFAFAFALALALALGLEFTFESETGGLNLAHNASFDFLDGVASKL